MFKFLKKAFKGFTKKVEKEVKEEKVKVKEKKETKKGFFEEVTKFVTEIRLSEASFEKIFSELEVQLLESNVAYGVVSKIKAELKQDLVGKSIKRAEIEKKIKDDLKKLILGVFEKPLPVDLLKLTQLHKPLVLLFVGVNGVGKTTTMAKVAKWLQDNSLSCVFSASDTFRAASIEQLKVHADALNINMISHKYGADPAAVAFDAVKHARAKGIDVVLIDTAGRQHANVDLMAELQKVKRVSKPHATILVVDALTGNDAVEQAKLFNEKVIVDGSILAKVDADEKGGALISVAHAIQKPILFLGVGQNYEDLEIFDAKKIIDKLI